MGVDNARGLDVNVSVRATAGLLGAVVGRMLVTGRMAVVITLEWVPVESGLFTAAAYRQEARQLYLRFRDGDIYRYFACPVSVYRAFLSAESKGRYFAQQTSQPVSA